MTARRTLAVGLALALTAACGSDDGTVAPPDCEVAAGTGPVMPATGLCQQLSSYRLFTDLPSQTAAPELTAYDLAVPLFSDYAVKHRWLYLPPGTAAAWDQDDALDLPMGAMLVKSFAYPHDLRDPGAGARQLETRILMRQPAGWKAASYVWRDDGSDADLAVAGALLDTSFIDTSGATVTNRYEVPNTNQCLNCHGEHLAVMSPLGPKVRHLNRLAPDGSGNQLQLLIDAGRLTDAPDPTTWPADPALDDEAAPLADRARAWLDVNCAHCHNPTGPARTSGLDLSFRQTDPSMWGLCKTPVAAGAGSGGRFYDIVPGQPDQSILVFRLESTQPQIRMPELGRNLVHAESLALIRAWIAEMPGACAQ
ncbi:MAG: SO2930 family diheme c-type cytochrome [Kofleriaceae bacterium]